MAMAVRLPQLTAPEVIAQPPMAAAVMAEGEIERDQSRGRRFAAIGRRASVALRLSATPHQRRQTPEGRTK